LQALEFWKTVTADHANLLQSLVGLLKERKVRYCVIGDAAVNAYAEPLVGLDLDLAIAADQIPEVERWLADRFDVRRLARSLSVPVQDSNLRVQIRTETRYSAFVERAIVRDVLGLKLPVLTCKMFSRARSGLLWTSSCRPARGRRTWSISRA
jgi:hypothetical protein